MSGNPQRGRGRGGPQRGRGSGTASPAPSSTSGTGSGFAGRGGRGGGDFGGGRGGGDFTGGRGGRGGGRGGDFGGRGGQRGGPGGGRGGGGRGGPAEVFAAGTPARVDARLSSVDALVKSFSSMRVGPEMPLRPGFGTASKAHVLRANFFALQLPPKLEIYDYEVAISPKADLRGPRKARIFELLEGSPECAPFRGYIAHDRSARLVSARKLPQPLALTIRFYEEGAPGPDDRAPVYNVEVILTRTLAGKDITPHLEGRDRDYDTAPLISALNMIVQKHASETGVRVGQNKYFFPAEDRFPLSLGLEACRGFFVSVRPSFKQLMVNINVAMTAFYTPGNLADAMLAFQQQVGTLPKEFFETLKVVTRHLGYPRKKAILRVMGTTPRQTTFDCKGKKITVEQYFKQEYKITLQYAAVLPVVNLGTKDKPNYTPPELCEIAPGTPFRGLLPDTATAEMIKVACNPPAFNANQIVNQGFTLLGLTGPNNTLTNFGLSVDRNMTTVPARFLTPPRVVYRAGAPSVKDAGWNVLGIKFQEGASLTNWAVMLVQDGRRGEFSGTSDPELRKFIETFMAKCRACGMNVPQAAPTLLATPRLPPPQNDAGRRQAMRVIGDTLKNGLNPQRKPSIVLVLLSGIDKFIYPGLKRLCDMQLGLQTVCMLLTPTKALPVDRRTGQFDPQKQDQYFSNVALKVNVKLGGVNHLLAPENMRWLTEKKTMLVGMDVTHPSPGSMKGTPSICAVVASMDDRFVHFPAGLSIQRNKNIDKDSEEMIQGLTGVMVERLQLYERKMKTLPERIIVYRDGVSEGQYQLVLQKELPQILKAFEKFNTQGRKGSYRPNVSIIVCGKRHHARNYAAEAANMTKNGNTPPGTVVDQGITDIYNHDFYLQAHFGLQGQVRPTHYIVVYDENKLSADVLQGGTHNASYMYARATKAVSLVPPAYYADLACERARTYLSTFLRAEDSRSTSSRGNPEAERAARERVYQEAEREWGAGVHKDLQQSMFYI